MKSDMKDMEITKELKQAIEINQLELKNAICNHQDIILSLNDDANNDKLQKKLKQAEKQIIIVGLEQKTLLERLREEYRAHQKSLKAGIVKNGIEDRRFNLSTAISRARKQHIVTRAASVTSFSDDSTEGHSIHSSPEHSHPVEPHDVSQSKFLSYFCLATHEVYKEMQNKRAERKRRSTANPQFLYGSKSWDFFGGKRAKRNTYLVSNISPPNTRQSVKKRNERTSPPICSSNGNINGSSDIGKAVYSPFPAIPNLPSGLTIERVSPPGSSPDSKSCITCRQPGLLTLCEVCTNGFHVSCHNRPFAQVPRRCPQCINKEVRAVGTLNVPTGMSVSYVTASEVSEKLEEKRRLEAKNLSLSAELTQLQDRHSQLTISLKNQKSQQEEILKTQQSTEEKIKQILNFITAIKNPLPEKA